MKQIRWIWSLTKKKRGMILGLLVLVSVIAVFQVCLAVAVQLIVDKAQGKGAAPLSFLMTAVVLTGLSVCCWMGLSCICRIIPS